MAHGNPHTLKNAPASASALATPNGTGVSLDYVKELGGGWRQARLRLVNTPVVMADNAGVVAYGSLKVMDMPEGLMAFAGAVMDLAITKSSAGVIDTWDGDIALGTTAADNSAALAATEQDLIPTTATPQAVAGATTGDAKSTSTEAFKLLDGTSAAKDVYLNVLVDDTDHDVTGTPCNLIMNGTITLHYMMLGDV